MKKVLNFLVMLFLFIPLVACSTTERNVEIVRTQWDSSDVQGQFHIIDSADELNEYVSVENCMKLSNAVEKYDESFFEDKTLVFVLLSEGSGSVSHKVRSINFNNGVLEVKVKRKVPEMGTCDMAEWTVMFEISKEEASSIVDTKLVLVQIWGFQEGKVSFAYKNFLGYKKGADGKIEIDEAQAVIVKMIYRMFLIEGKTCTSIATYLAENGVLTPSGKSTRWQKNTVLSILRNEKYKGDALLQKTFTDNYLEHSMKKNEGELPQYYVENSHPAIIDKYTWSKFKPNYKGEWKLETSIHQLAYLLPNQYVKIVVVSLVKRYGTQLVNTQERSINAIANLKKAKTNVERHTLLKMK